MSLAAPFIKRPVLTTVCTLIILLLGSICIPLLPLEYLPNISPIQVLVTSSYPGADALTVEQAVTTPIERQINGVPGMQYMTSNSFAGTSAITVFFGPDTDKDINQVNVQNRVAIASPQLPTSVQKQGVVTQVASSSILLVYGFYSPDGSYDSTFLSNYVDLNIYDELLRTPGVGQISYFGQRQYAMRLWLDPEALAARNLSVSDVATALERQSILIPAGAIGQEPAPPGQKDQIPIRVISQFETPEQFAELVLRSGENGDLVKLRDVGRAELGAQSYAQTARVNGKAGVGIGIYQLPGSNALDVAERIEEKMAELKQRFPAGMEAVLVYDTTAFVQASLDEVFKTLFEAIALVILVIFLFLQDWRTTIIPVIAIPVSLIGSLVFALGLGFSLNNLTLFGLILATGLVVDDAIVVVEAVTTKLEEGKKPLQASLEAMEELSGAIIATSLVLLAVFVPVAFFPGSTGRMYQQFALIIAFSIVVSTFNALSFSPTMAALIMRRSELGTGPLGRFFAAFNRGFGWLLKRYGTLVERVIRARRWVLVLFGLGLAGTVLCFQLVPTGFVPDEDQGAILGIAQTPDGVAQQQTDALLASVEKTLSNAPEVTATFTVSGMGFNGNSPNQGIFFALLKPWEERTGAGESSNELLERWNGAFRQLAGQGQGFAKAFNPPAIPGFSATGGFQLQVNDESGGQLTLEDLVQNSREIIARANGNPALAGQAFTQVSIDAPQLQVTIDRDRLAALDVDFATALNSLGGALGSAYVNQFLMGPRNYQVYIQANEQFRATPEALARLYVTSRRGESVPLAQLLTVEQLSAPQIVNHYNIYRTVQIQGNQAPGYSSGQALQALDEAVKAKGIRGIGSDWVGTAREQLAAGNLAALIFAFGIVMVFLFLSAQYESYIDPIIILLTVPLAILGALVSVGLRGLVNDVYCNVALVMLIGLASKNAILIVEFANQARTQGASIAQAAITACRERFRPILMTAGSGLAGFWPLVVASGAGAGSRWSLGTAVFGGLLVATVLSLLVVPVLYVVIKSLEDRYLTRSVKVDDEPA